MTATRMTLAVIFGVAKSLFKGLSPSPKPQLPQSVSVPPQMPQEAHGNQTINVFVSPTQPSLAPPSKIPPDDGRLYLTWQGDISLHLRSDDLLERVDYIAQVKFLDTAENIKPLKLDTSGPTALRFDLPQLQEEFAPFIPDSKPLAIPSDDSEIYIADGKSFSRAGDIPLSLPKRVEPPILMKLLYVPVPPDDGELWVARTTDILPLKEYPEAARPNPCP